MAAIISSESFSKFTEEEKKALRDFFKSSAQTYPLAKVFEQDDLIDPNRPVVEIWDDMENAYEEIDNNFVMYEESLYDIICDTNLYGKLLATYQIHYLIEYGYGGVITNDEWKAASTFKDENAVWSIYTEYTPDGIQFKIDKNYADPFFVSFHTKNQAERFLSHNENIKLIKEYYMINSHGM